MRQALRSCAQMMTIAWRNGRTKMALATLLMVAGGASWPLLAFTVKEGVNAAVRRDLDAAATAGAWLGVLLIAALILQHFAYVPYAEVTELAVVNLSAELIELTSGAPGVAHLERREDADRIDVLRREIAQFADAMVGLMAMLSLTVSMVLTGLVLASLNPWLLLLPVAAVPPLFATHRGQRLLDGARLRAATATRQAQNLFDLGTSVAGAKELRVFRLRDEIRRRHRELWSGIGGVLWRGEARATATEAVGQLAYSAAFVAAVLFMLRETVAGRNQVGDAVLVIVLALQINLQVNAALDLFRRLQRMVHGMARLDWLRATVASQRPPETNDVLPDTIRRGVEFRDVSFSYPDAERPSLSGINLILPAGSVVAIVGENGAGKSTLVKLLCRFYDATSGRIELDGVDIRRYPAEQWRRRISAGFQDFVRFEVLAQHTVGVGEQSRMDDPAAVYAALHRARAADVVERLPNGLATQLGKSWTDGTELSGGQWQKLALGRAMMRVAPLFLVLDEPTSALDPEAEHDLFERYAENARRLAATTGAVTVLVSHRFSTVRMADQILVVADGRIIEAGGHATLMSNNGVYAGLYRLQADAYRR